VSAPFLRLRRLEVRHRRVRVLQNFSAELDPGGIWWVVGENGAGKSTFLRALVGRVPLSGGEMLLGERPLLASDTAYFHPGIHPPPDVRTADFLAVADALGRSIRRDSLISWEPIGEQRLERLSTGQAKRLLLALLLRSDAPVLALDEPFDHLSESGRNALLDRLRLRATERIVVVSTNQGIPQWEPRTRVIDFDRVEAGMPS
jgi:ABC-type multidrug transport system ATPase subunit